MVADRSMVDDLVEYQNVSIVNDIARQNADGSMSYCNRVTAYWTRRRATINFVEY